MGGDVSTITSNIAAKNIAAQEAMVKSGRKDDSIRSWIKNPGPL